MAKPIDQRRAEFLNAKAERIQGERIRFDCSIYVRSADARFSEWQEHEVKPGESVRYGDQRQDNSGAWMIPDYMTYSDYSGSTVEESNVRVWLTEIDPDMRATVELRGGHGTRGIAVYLPNLTPDQLDTLSALSDYPLIDDNAHSDLECEREQEDWESFGRGDFVRACERELSIDLSECSDEDIDAAVWSCTDITDRAGDLYHAEGISFYFNSRRMAETFGAERALAIPGAASTEADE